MKCSRCSNVVSPKYSSAEKSFLSYSCDCKFFFIINKINNEMEHYIFICGLYRISCCIMGLNCGKSCIFPGRTEINMLIDPKITEKKLEKLMLLI